jgi:peptide/nickel transport system substrate-binding protein
MLENLGFACLFFFILAPPSFCAEPQYGGILRTALLANPRSLDPHMSWECETPVNTYNTLLRWNKDMSRHELDLAESLDRPDDLTYVFKLRKGVRFHLLPPVNGREFTSEDVKYSIERAAGMHGLKALFPQRFRFEGKIESILTPDPHTVVIRTKDPYAPLLNYLASFLWPPSFPKRQWKNSAT